MTHNMGKNLCPQLNTCGDRQTGRRADRQKDRQTGKQTDRQTDRYSCIYIHI